MSTIVKRHSDQFTFLFSLYTETHNDFCTVKSQTYGIVKRTPFSNYTWTHEQKLLEDCTGSWLQAITEYILLCDVCYSPNSNIVLPRIHGQFQNQPPISW